MRFKAGALLEPRGIDRRCPWHVSLAGAVFLRLQRDADRVASDLAKVRYHVRLRGSRTAVAHYDDESDLSDDIERTFARFQRDAGNPSDHRGGGSASQLDTAESRILERVALAFPLEFAALDEFRPAHADFIDPVVNRFDREVHLSYLDLVAPLRNGGLRLGPAPVSDESKDEASPGPWRRYPSLP